MCACSWHLIVYGFWFGLRWPWYTSSLPNISYKSLVGVRFTFQLIIVYINSLCIRIYFKLWSRLLSYLFNAFHIHITKWNFSHLFLPKHFNMPWVREKTRVMYDVSVFICAVWLCLRVCVCGRSDFYDIHSAVLLSNSNKILRMKNSCI